MLPSPGGWVCTGGRYGAEGYVVTVVPGVAGRLHSKGWQGRLSGRNGDAAKNGAARSRRDVPHVTAAPSRKVRGNTTHAGGDGAVELAVKNGARAAAGAQDSRGGTRR